MNSIKILTYNVMAQKYPYYKKDKVEKCGMKYYEWNYRREKIIDILLQSDADIICLQEVDIEPRDLPIFENRPEVSNKNESNDTSNDSSVISFLNDYKDIINMGYDYFMHNKTKQRTSDIGNVILWKKSLFSTVDRKNTSCSNIIIFEHNITGYKFKLANVHLKAGINSGEDIRLSQIKSVCNNKPDIICGDFNDDFDTNNLLYKFVNQVGYKIYNKQKTCCVVDVDYLKYWCFDNVISKKDIIKTEELKDMLNGKIPDDNNPSDHTPLTFILAIN